MRTNHLVIGATLFILVALGFLLNGPTKEGLRVGVLVPPSGNFAVLGERVRNGFELAKADLASHGTFVEVIYEDACQPKEALSAITKLIESDRITLLGGSFCVAGFVPVIDVLEKHQVIGVNLAPNPDSVLGHDYVVSTNTSIKLKANELGAFAADTLRAKTAAILYYNTPLGEDYRKHFSAAFEERGGEIVLEQVTLIDASDFRTELTKIKQKNPDVIFVVQLARPLGNLLKQANELGIESRMLGNSQNEDPSVIEVAGVSAEGFYISSDEPLPPSENVLDFNRRYKERFGQEADVFARNAYDALILEAAAYKHCAGETDCMLAYFHAIKNYDGVSGSISIEEDGTAFKPTSFKVIKNGMFVSVDR